MRNRAANIQRTTAYLQMMHIRQAVLLCHLQLLKQYYNYAYVSAISVGLQIVDVEKSRLMYQKSREAVIGGYDTVNNRCGEIVCGQPVDVVAYRSGYVLMTTMRGNVLIFNVNMPNMPTLASYTKLPDTYWRAGAVSDYTYIDSNGQTQTIDLAIVGGVSGRPILLDITDPVNPRQIGQVNDFTVGMAGVAISKSAKLAYITGPSAVYVVDIKDPEHPVLLNQVGAETYADGTSVSLPSLRRIVEKDGWVYLADYGGMTMVDLDPFLLELIKEDAEFPNVALPVNEYYPALGEKVIAVRAKLASATATYGTTDDFLNGFDITKWGLKLVSTDPAAGVIVKRLSTDGKCLAAVSPGDYLQDSFTPVGLLSDGSARFCIAMDNQQKDLPGNFSIKLRAQRRDTIFANKNTATDPQTFAFVVKHNGNVTLQQVLEGKAVFVFDDKLEEARHGAYRASQDSDVTREGERRFYYVQEMLNQIVSRKRNLVNLSGGYTYGLIDEDGRYGKYAYNSLAMFKYNFNLGVNTVAGAYDAAGQKYAANDNTSPIFRKLMKDYGKRQASATSWLIDGAANDSWFYKIIDKNTLVGNTEMIPAETVAVTDENADVRINDPADTTRRNDTGLYELYKNIVERFVKRMIWEAERYAGQSGRRIPAPTTNWIGRTTGGTGPGMSYCYGGKQNVTAFNDTVANCQAPDAPTIRSYENTAHPYRRNLHATQCNIGGGDKRWAGLYFHDGRKRQEQQLFQRCINDPKTRIKCTAAEIREARPFNPSYWSGIDCSGLVQQSVEYARHVNDYTDADEAADPARKISIPGVNITIPPPPGDINAAGYFDIHHGDHVFIMASTTRRALLKKGDLNSYPGHISMMYDIPDECRNNNSCNYSIIHASGDNNIRYEASEDETALTTFNRKVVINEINARLSSDTLRKPTQHGRIKLW